MPRLSLTLTCSTLHGSSLLSEVSFIHTAKENSTIELISFARPNSAQLLAVLTLSLDVQVPQGIASSADQALIHTI